jgi:hypothetical protein
MVGGLLLKTTYNLSITLGLKEINHSVSTFRSTNYLIFFKSGTLSHKKKV